MVETYNHEEKSPFLSVSMPYEKPAESTDYLMGIRTLRQRIKRKF